MIIYRFAAFAALISELSGNSGQFIFVLLSPDWFCSESISGFRSITFIDFFLLMQKLRVMVSIDLVHDFTLSS